MKLIYEVVLLQWCKDFVCLDTVFEVLSEFQGSYTRQTKCNWARQNFHSRYYTCRWSKWTISAWTWLHCNYVWLDPYPYFRVRDVPSINDCHLL